MHIVIVGDGKVGYTLSEQLSNEKHDVTIIDNNRRTLETTLDTLDVIGVHGNGAVLDVQNEAGVPDADLLIAATSSDELNMLCCIMAKHLGAQSTIARVRNPEYTKQLHLLKEQFGLSMVINPDMEAAREISRVIKFPPALKVDTFSKGRVELVEYKIKAGQPIDGKKLSELGSKQDTKVLICAVDRGGEILIPHGDFILQAGDKIHITGESRNISRFLAAVEKTKKDIRTVMIVGGGRMAYYLASILDERIFQIKIVELRPERCNELSDLLPRAVIINGDGSDLDILESEGLLNADAFIALTGMDEENMIMSMLASKRNVPKVVTKINRFHFIPLAEEMGVDTVISPKMTTANQIMQYVRAMHNTMGSQVKTLHKLINDKAEALEFTAAANTKYLDIPLEKLKLKAGLLIAVIVRAGRVIIPDGQDYIHLGDSVIVFTSTLKLGDLNDIFKEGF